jgi:putative tryptophan/tyrosine transport system substrate-binding protein
MYTWSMQLDEGGLLAYGPDNAEVYRQFAELILKAVRGTSAHDIRFAQPTRFRLAVNLKTARALNLTIPQSLLVRADSVIQ